MASKTGRHAGGPATGRRPPPARAGDAAAPGRSDASLEDACSRLCLVAMHMVDAPAALVSLNENERPYLVGTGGLDHPAGGWSSSPLALCLAGHSGARGEPLAIRDVEGRDLLASDPLHAELGFRAFLALPIRLGEETLGSLCALDRVARPWSSDDVQALAWVAESIVTEVRLRGSFRLIRSVEAQTSREARQSFSSLVDDLDAIVNERDVSTGAFTFVSRRAESLLGYPLDRWTDEEGFWTDVVIHPSDRARVVREIGRGMREGRGHDLQYRVRTADGAVLWIRDLIRMVSHEDGTPRFLRGVMIDVTDQRETEGALRLLQELAMVANDADSPEEPFRLALERVCQHTGWPVGHVYRREGDRMVPSDLWHVDDREARRPFIEASSRAEFARGSGLPGTVLATGRPAWIRDVSTDEDVLRRAEAAASGLAAGFAFPVLAGRETVAVCEFFSEEPLDPDEALLELTGHVGTILGRIEERARAQEELRRAELKARRTVETAHEAFIAIDESGRVREWNAEAERIFGWSRNEAAGRELADLIVPERHREAHRRGLQRYLATGEGALLGRLVEIEGVRKDGSEVPVELSITPLDLGDTTVFNAFLRDITDRRRQEEERRRRERQLAEAQRLAGLGSWEWDPEEDRITWSEELHRIFGTDPETFEPDFRSFLERIHPEDRDLVESVVGAAAETYEDFTFEHRIVRDDGTVRRVLGQGRAEAGPDGRGTRLAGTAQDITERRALEEKERELAAEQAARGEAEAAEGRITEILESITDAFLAVDRDWRFTYLNAEAERLLGLTAEELGDATLGEALPAGSDRLHAELLDAVERARPVEVQEFYEPAGRWLEVRAFPSERGLSVYLHDITDRREAEARLRASEERYRFLSDSIPQQVWTAGPDGRLDYLNQVAEDYFDRPAAELVADGWEALVHPDDLGHTLERWSASLERGEPWEAEFRLAGADGAYRWHLARARPQRDDGGDIVRWFGTSTDVHDQKELERSRDEALEELERVTHVLSSERVHLEEQAREMRRYARALKRSNEELDQFAYVASHDLKAPLRGIANLTEWLLDDLSGHLTGETREYADLLQNRVHRMEALIDGILQYSRAGREHHQPEEVDVAELIREVVDLIDPPDDFVIEVEGWMPTLLAERVTLQQVFLNLVGNAVKHADVDDPRVTVRLSDEGGDFYEFSVEDNGPGIDPEFQDRIWTLFQTLRPRDEVEGTGIGLSVVKRTVEGQGGQVWVESDPGRGACFRFLWPRTPPERSDAIG